MNNSPTNAAFRERAASAVADPNLRRALKKAMDVFVTKRTKGVAGVPMEEYREAASELRNQVLADLPALVDEFTAAATRAGAIVYRASDAQSARDAVLNILRDRKAMRVVKAKSMVTEEIHLNQHLEAHGIRVTETDLGEYIVQLAGEPPSHLLAPAIHKDRFQIGRLFSEKLGVPLADDPKILTGIARKALREEFLQADAGISGANFAAARSGSLVIFTNEGNGRMVTTLPPLHIAVLTIEKMIPSLADLPAFIRLLARSASGQPMSSYVSVITGTRKPGEVTGAGELHIVLVDNGRWDILTGEYRDILKCIRCSACTNICPVYRVIGGHAYGFTYSGPMGIVLTAVLEGLEKAHELLDATTLCGACVEVCPVKVPLTDLLIRLKENRARLNLGPLAERVGMAGYGLACQNPALFRAGRKTLSKLWPVLLSIAEPGTLERLPEPAPNAFGDKKR